MSNFRIEIKLKKPNGTHTIKTYNFRGLFDAQAKTLKYFDALIASLKPESHSKSIQILAYDDNFKIMKEFKTKSWSEEHEFSN